MTTPVPTSGGAPTRVFPVPTPLDIDIVARTLYGEARGEGRDGMMAVAEVIRNRMLAAREWLRKNPDKKKHPLFGDGTLQGVCLTAWQFSCWNENDPNLPKLKAVKPGEYPFSVCLDVADVCAANRLSNDVLGATHYFDRRMTKPPAWSIGAKYCGQIGNHRFYRDVK